ncbi:thiol:disulfide interchange protein DsbB [Salana multivorans]|uniref:Thiol:disulfide interchange protein DsbB n=1 Tax=Salana multivorans TaxID=120377 RepID=A0A3N2D929_9MICO|nr:disulfide bond formation protein B [Salana multivorans]ROR96297.1 thiol:disulfide interchange protein DsbB [Salana multivorans]
MTTKPSPTTTHVADGGDTAASSPTPTAWVVSVFSERVFNIAVASAALLVMALPVGIATIYLGFVHGESPCTLCGFERFGMVVVAILALFILRYGPRRKYLFTLILTAVFFLYATVIQWMRYAPRDVGQGFAEDVFGVHTYTWGTFVFWVIIAFAAVGLLWVSRDERLLAEFGGREIRVKRYSRYSTVAGAVTFAMILLNCVQFLIIDGPPPFTGTGQPPRMTLDITKTAPNWSLHLWERVGTLTVHSYSPPMVHIPGVHDVEMAHTGSAADAPVPVSGTLELLDTTPLGFEAVGPFGGRAGGIAYDEATGLFGIVSTGGGLYYVENDFSTVVSSAVLDTVNGNNVRETTDAMFLGPNQLVGLAWNKTLYGAQRVGADEADDWESWKEYRSSTGDLEPLWGVKSRQMLQTIRAKSAFALSIAMDQDTGRYAVVSVPSPQTGDFIVVSEFGPDHKLAREGVLTAGESEVDLSGYYPVGATILDGTMFLLSKTYQSLLVVDMDTLRVTATWELPEIGDYHGIAAADGSFFVLADDGGDDIVARLVPPTGS